MSLALERLLAADGRTLAMEEGEPDVLRVLPPCPVARVAEIEAEIGFALPRELKAILARSTGLEGAITETVDLARVERCGLDSLFGWMVNVVGDGAGNYWQLELRPEMEVLGPVWFLCHDPGVVVYQSDDLASFLDGWLRYNTFPGSGPLVEVAAQKVNDVRDQTSDVPRATLLDSSDPVLCNFAASLDDPWFIADLRRARVGDGMPLYRYGPKTPHARAGTEHVFAYASRTRAERLKTWFTGR